MGRRRRGRKRHSRKATVSTVKAIVQKEVGKTRETNKMVSFIGWSRLNDILLSSMPPSPATPNPEQSFCLYSVTGGLDSGINTTMDPNAYVAKNLFTLLPTDSQNTAVVGALTGAGQAQQGGTLNEMDASAGIGGQSITSAIANVHQLEGRECFLKKFYANVCLNNSSSSVVTPTNMLVRCVVFQTRRPLSKDSLSTQILLQNHGQISMLGLTDPYPTSALGYLNRDIISKVYYDKTYTLNGASGATGSLKRFKLSININKKAKWSYYYQHRVTPTNNDQTLVYAGPYIYMAMWASSSSTYGSVFDSVNGIGEARRPAFSASTILTFLDD